MERSALEMVKVLLPGLLLCRPEAGAPLSLPLQLCPLTRSFPSLLNLHLFLCISVFPFQHGHQTLEHTGLTSHQRTSLCCRQLPWPPVDTSRSYTLPSLHSGSHKATLGPMSHIVSNSLTFSFSPKVTQSYAHDHTVTQLHAHCRRHNHIRSHVVTHMAKLFTRGLIVSHTLSITRPHGDTVSHTW